MAATRTPISIWFGRFVCCRVNAHLAQTSYLQDVILRSERSLRAMKNLQLR